MSGQSVRSASIPKEGTMASTPQNTGTPVNARLVDRDKVELQFAIDDLVKQLGSTVQVASCNGCNHCKAEAETIASEK